jgi:cell division septum initiation protein DivIVA
MERPTDFELVWHGYNPYQVNRYIDYLTGRLEIALASLDDVAALQRDLAIAHGEIERLRTMSRYVPRAATVGDRISEILALAEEQAAQMRQQAEQEVQQMRDAAEKQAERIAEEGRERGRSSRSKSRSGAPS